MVLSSVDLQVNFRIGDFLGCSPEFIYFLEVDLVLEDAKFKLFGVCYGVFVDGVLAVMVGVGLSADVLGLH